MTMSVEERRARLRQRGEESARDRGQRNLGSSGHSPLDFSKAGYEVKKFELTSDPRNLNQLDIVPFEITSPIYATMRQFSGKPTNRQVGDWDYKMEICVHKKVGSAQIPMLCLREMFGSKCVICDDMFAEYKKRGTNDFNEDLAKSLQPQWRTIYKVFDYRDTIDDFKVWDVAYKTFEEYLCEKAENSEEGYVTFADPLEGRILEVEGKLKKIGRTDYIEPVGLRFLKRGQPYTEADIKILPLDQMLIIPTYEEVCNVYYYGGDQEAPTQEQQPEPERQPEQIRRRSSEQPAPTNPCPAGGRYGIDTHILPACQNTCPQDVFDRCCDERERQAPPVQESPKEESLAPRRGAPSSPPADPAPSRRTASPQPSTPTADPVPPRRRR